MLHGPTTSALSGSLLEMQGLRLPPRLTKFDLYCIDISGWSRCTLMFEKDWTKTNGGPFHRYLLSTPFLEFVWREILLRLRVHPDDPPSDLNVLGILIPSLSSILELEQEANSLHWLEPYWLRKGQYTSSQIRESFT